MSAAFVIGSIAIKDAAKWDAYRAQVPATIAPWQGEVLVRGRKLVALSGEVAHTDTVVIRFPSAEALRGWHDSPAYQALLPLRREAAEVTLVAYQV